MEKLQLNEFDILGIITLNDVLGIEKYVTPLIKDGQLQGYLSRSKEYYNVKSMTELAIEREDLKAKLTRDHSKKNFVILENMLNCSAKVYFKKFENYIKKGKDEYSSSQLSQAYNCLMEDVKNILVLLSGEGLIEISSNNILPAGAENSLKRPIEMDNKAMLYLFLKCLKPNKDAKDIEVLTPGYGSIYIGPFLKSMYGYNFTNMLKSKYIQETMQLVNSDIKQATSSERIFEAGKTILLLDDNIGTGNTMREIKGELIKNGVKDIFSGAVQYNWINFFKVSVGEKKDIDRFEVGEFEIISPLNFAGHKLYKHAIDLLHSSGEEYVQYLESKGYRSSEYSDLEGALDRGIYCAQKTGLELSKKEVIPKRTILNKDIEELPLLPQYKDAPTEITNSTSKQIIENITKMLLMTTSKTISTTENIKKYPQL